ncbi:MAG: S8 family serine peptidase [Actinomycetota bacterium]
MRKRLPVSVLAAVALLLTGLSGARADDSPQVAVRLQPGGLAAAGVEASFSAGYGWFDWAVVPTEALEDLRRANVAFQAYPEAGRLVLPSASFDPLTRLPHIAADVAAGRPALHLVQFHGPIKDAWLDAVRAGGARLVQYLAPFTFVVLATPEDAAALADVAAVRWVGAFEPAYRFGDLRAGNATILNVLLVDDGHAGEALERLTAAGGRLEVTGRQAIGDVELIGVQVAATPAAIEAATSLSAVYAISPQLAPAARDEMSNQISAGNYTGDGVPLPGYEEWLAGHQVDGTGVVVAHVDTGVSARHPDLQGQLHGCHDYTTGQLGILCLAEMTDTFGHGTHTAGIIVGTGSTGLTDGDGFEFGLGMAPGAKLFAQNFIGLLTPFAPSGPGQYIELNKDSVLGDATISANSWGPSGRPRGYDADTREFDHAPRDANLDTPEHEPLTWVLSIMNGRGGTSTQGTPDEGKNLLRVGATENFRAGQIDDLSFVTAHGPALDGRRLPDIVAPGERVVSTADPVTIGLCLDPVIGLGIILYSHCTGTSMASPHVSGGAALFTEHYRDLFGEDPSPVLIKAAFVNGAVDLAGNRDADGNILGHVPDNKQGWGRFNLENVLGGSSKTYVDQAVLLSTTGARWQARVRAIDRSEPVKVTLVWTDAPGHGLGGATPAWVNDLDLRVVSRGQTYLGNWFGEPSTGWSVPGGAADFMNNVENVFLASPGGAIEVEVLGANLAGDGVPGIGDDTDQDFALVISNGRIVKARSGDPGTP